jgi:hypothetical protein
MIHRQTTAMSMTTTTYTNTNSNANAPVAAADDRDCGTAYATSADLCAPYITLEEVWKERQEEERNEQRREQWDNHLECAQFRASKRWRAAQKEETDADKGAALRARLSSSLSSFFLQDEETEVTRLAPLVEECLDTGRHTRARAAARVGAARAAMEGVPLQGGPRVRGNAAVPAPLGGC